MGGDEEGELGMEVVSFAKGGRNEWRFDSWRLSQGSRAIQAEVNDVSAVL